MDPRSDVIVDSPTGTGRTPPKRADRIVDPAPDEELSALGPAGHRELTIIAQDRAVTGSDGKILRGGGRAGVGDTGHVSGGHRC